MKNKLIKIWGVLSRKRKKQLFLNLILMITSGLSEMISLALLTPLLTYLISGGNQELQLILVPNFLIISDFRILTLLVICSFIAAGLIRTFNLFVNTRMAALIGHDLAYKSYINTINRDYLWHKYNNSSQVIAVISTHTNVTSQVVANTLQMATSFLVLIGLICTLLIVEWKYGNIAILSFSAVYYLLVFKSKRKLLNNSYEIAKSTNLHIKNIKETINSIKDIILYNSEKIFSKKFGEIDLNMRKYIGFNQFIAGYPRFAIEALGITIFALIAIVNISLGEDNYRVFTGIALVAIAAQKILPSMQQLYAAWAFIKANTGAVEEVLYFSRNLNNKQTYSNIKEKKEKVFENLEVNLIEFNYPKIEKSILKNLNFKINKGEFVGIIGESGKGKSTLLDLILGLLTPEKGDIKINGGSIHGEKNVFLKKSWQSIIAHVPQNPILFDGSIEENINFGSDNELDIRKLIKSSKLSNIYDLIKNLPKGFKTKIGENGSTLSGGQKQRIAIARALYKEAQVLILDEPTSSLDLETGKEIIKTLITLQEKNFTIIIVTHNENDIKNCDKIIELK